MDNSSDTVLTKKVAAHFKIICHLDHSSSHFLTLHDKNYTIQCEEQDGSKRKFVEGMMAKIWPSFHLHVAKNKEMK